MKPLAIGTTIQNNKPIHDGFWMPGEFEPHEGTWMLWPIRTDTWRLGAKLAQMAFYDVAIAISQFEPVTMGVMSQQYEHVRSLFPQQVRVVELSYNDAWMRDIGPTFVKNGQGEVRGIDWGFNAWGGLKDGLYFPWDQDLFVKKKVLDIERKRRYDANHIILEGGAFTVDGEGTLITTEQCLLNPNRNPNLTRQDIELLLSEYLNVKKIIWLKNGMLDDETDGHVDEVVAFVRPGVVCMSWTEDTNDPQYKVLNAAYEVLKHSKDAKGRQLEIHKIQIPKQLVLSDEEARLIDRAKQSYRRSSGTRFAATYVNFYICNGGVVMPAFGDKQDKNAFEQVQALFPDRKVIQVNTKEIALGGGNIHCITQQQPKP
ncbi:agmatine deiminase [Terrilactibacillus laevilacticus]|uniref:agmatine deiminase n=1 Tax=Terrilactibacillus laevilacticus TaxID=1380157 RepID=UPI0011473268|nr:agmatine deiminase [Terrilactibacillus laevilacticus]